MPHQRKRLGDWGEAYARRFLQRHGYCIIESNYRCPYGEIDLVARDGDCLVFVEVKSRRSEAFGRPQEAVTPAKQQKLVQSAQEYIQSHADLPQMWRIDVVGIQLGGRNPRPRVELIRNAVTPDHA